MRICLHKNVVMTSFYNVTRQHLDYVHDVILFIITNVTLRGRSDQVSASAAEKKYIDYLSHTHEAAATSLVMPLENQSGVVILTEPPFLGPLGPF